MSFLTCYEIGELVGDLPNIPLPGQFGAPDYYRLFQSDFAGQSTCTLVGPGGKAEVDTSCFEYVSAAPAFQRQLYSVVPCNTLKDGAPGMCAVRRPLGPTPAASVRTAMATTGNDFVVGNGPEIAILNDRPVVPGTADAVDVLRAQFPPEAALKEMAWNGDVVVS